MKYKESSMAGGLWMLVALVAMLSTPLAVGYFTLSNSPAPAQHADASVR